MKKATVARRSPSPEKLARSYGSAMLVAPR